SQVASPPGHCQAAQQGSSRSIGLARADQWQMPAPTWARAIGAILDTASMADERGGRPAAVNQGTWLAVQDA
ncbi:MAG TPA: hypothetical protein VF516_33275, partial [Kofleriaceae bacterium]